MESTGLQVAVTGKTATATVHIVDREGREYQHPVDLSCELVSSDGQNKATAEVHKLENGKYQVSFQPQNGGQHQLHIHVLDKPILSSPPVFAISPKPSLIMPKPNTMDRLNRPLGVAVSTSGDIIVSEWESNCISIFSKDGEKGRTFGSDQLNWPRGVAVTDTGDILVCDFTDNCIRLFSSEGEPLKCVGTRGSGRLQFDSPRYIAIHPHSKKIYVTDYFNNRVQVLNSDLTYYTSFGVGLNLPCGIAFDSSGSRVYVAGNSCVKVYTSDGKDDRKPIQQLCKDDSEHVMRYP